MSQLHMVSEADKQNNPCFVCVLLMVLWGPRGAAGLGSSRRTYQRRSQAPCRSCRLPSTHARTCAHTHNPQQIRAWWRWENKDPTQRTSGDTQGNREGRVSRMVEVRGEVKSYWLRCTHTLLDSYVIILIHLLGMYTVPHFLSENWGQESTWPFPY